MTLDRLIPDAAMASPDDVAVAGLEGRLSWAQYEARSAAVASFLVDAGLRPGDRVAVSFAKDAAAYVAVHGILRAGGTVVPIDPFGGALIGREAMADADVSAVLGSRASVARLEPWDIHTLDLRVIGVSGRTADLGGVMNWDEITTTPRGDLPSAGTDDPAYIIYTSGSTGRPKGIVHTHGSAMEYATRAADARQLSREDRVAGMSAFHFDMSTLELYAAPLAGSAVVAMSEAHLRMPASLVGRTAEEGVSVWYTVPALLQQVVTRGALDRHDLSRLRLVAFGGEPFPARPLAELMDALPHATFANIYGPAEVNECTNHVLGSRPTGDDGVPIGRPWQGVECRIVGDDDQPVEAGEPGELLVSAPTVMSGYWRRPDLDHRSLIPRENGVPPWYRTGDIVVEDDAQLMWFKGRRDHQVKLRGIRIELEAVENVLADVDGIIHAVVSADAPGSESATLVAALVVENDAPTDNEIRQWCAARLPAVAVPTSFRRLDAMPMTGTGKIDRRRVRDELLATERPFPTKAHS